MIETLQRTKTKRTPEIDFNAQTGKLSITGRSIPDNAVEFYQPLIDWVTEYLKKPLQKTELHINLEYASTSSTKIKMELIKCFKHLKDSDELDIHLYFEEDDDEIIPEYQSYVVADYTKVSETFICIVKLFIHTIFNDGHEDIKEIQIKEKTE